MDYFYHITYNLSCLHSARELLAGYAAPSSPILKIMKLQTRFLGIIAVFVVAAVAIFAGDTEFQGQFDKTLVRMSKTSKESSSSSFPITRSGT